MVSREDQIKFYADELKEYEFETKKIFNATAISLFDTGELYVGQFKGYDELRGNVFIDIPDNEISHSPRLDQRFTCFTLKAGQELPKVWGDMTFRDLLHDRIRTDSKIVDYIPSKREGWITMLIRDMDVLFLRELEHNQILGFGPTIPPYEYIENLLNLTRAIPAKFTGQRSWFDILFFKHDELIDERMPVLITEESDIPQVVTDSLVESDYFIFQGPPGSGKTHQIADLVSRLVLKGYSVLLTALTNKASAEVCEKSSFKSLLEENRVSKRPLSIEERRRFPKLLNAEELVPIRGHVHLSTYYQFSRIWKTSNETFDYIIVEEASQAFLTTIAAAKKVGKKVIVVGDPMQIVPIPNNNNYKALKNIELLVNGMSTLCRMPLLTFYRKVESRRLTERSVSYTNLFYENTIQSVPLYQDLDQDIKQLSSLSKVVHKFGGPVLILFPAKTKSVLSAMQHFLIESIDELSIIKNTQIAVLTPLIKTLTHLQKSLKSQTKSRKYLIDSVDRVQGLDVDYCFFVIEEPSSFSFNTNRFNVATSRAKKSTFILVPDDYNKKANLSRQVERYMDRLRREFAFYSHRLAEPFSESGGNKGVPNDVPRSVKAEIAGVKVVGKIDLSKFEKRPAGVKDNVQNLYVIDTNVFVDDPEVIKSIHQDYPIILSAKVLDELDNLKGKLDPEGQRKVQKALKSINYFIDKRDIRLEVADLSLLPDDFSKRSADNFILSVLLKFPRANAILLTSDNGLQVKAKGMGFTTLSLAEFRRRRK